MSQERFSSNLLATELSGEQGQFKEKGCRTGWDGKDTHHYSRLPCPNSTAYKDPGTASHAVLLFVCCC